MNRESRGPPRLPACVTGMGPDAALAITTP
jgi:hypothetical protein